MTDDWCLQGGVLVVRAIAVWQMIGVCRAACWWSVETPGTKFRCSFTASLDMSRVCWVFTAALQVNLLNLSTSLPPSRSGTDISLVSLVLWCLPTVELQRRIMPCFLFNVKLPFEQRCFSLWINLFTCHLNGQFAFAKLSMAASWLSVYDQLSFTCLWIISDSCCILCAPSDLEYRWDRVMLNAFVIIKPQYCTVIDLYLTVNSRGQSPLTCIFS